MNISLESLHRDRATIKPISTATTTATATATATTESSTQSIHVRDLGIVVEEMALVAVCLRANPSSVEVFPNPISQDNTSYR